METDLSEKFMQEYEKVKRSVKKPNILIAGATGSGKSSIINMIFGDTVATVGTGKPVTQKIDVYESPETDVRIFDSKGYEVGAAADKEFYASVVGLAQQTNNPQNAIHLIWYCIPCNGARVTDYDLQALQTFYDSGIPTAVVFTKADLPTEADLAALKAVLPQWAKGAAFEASTKMPEYNQLEDLIVWSIKKLPKALQDAFIKSQKLNLAEKWEQAHRIIAEHAVGAFTIGFTPIPMSDAPLLIANELFLFARILYFYDLGSLSDTLKTMGLGSVIGPLLTTGGKALAASLLKLIPGIGTIVGGVISGSVGACITAAVGEAISTTAYMICKAQLENDCEKAVELMNNFGNIMIEQAKHYIEQNKKTEDYRLEDIN